MQTFGEFLGITCNVHFLICRNGDELFATVNGEAGQQVKLLKYPDFDTQLITSGHQGAGNNR